MTTSGRSSWMAWPVSTRVTVGSSARASTSRSRSSMAALSRAARSGSKPGHTVSSVSVAQRISVGRGPKPWSGQHLHLAVGDVESFRIHRRVGEEGREVLPRLAYDLGLARSLGRQLLEQPAVQPGRQDIDEDGPDDLVRVIGRMHDATRGRWAVSRGAAGSVSYRLLPTWRAQVPGLPRSSPHALVVERDRGCLGGRSLPPNPRRCRATTPSGRAARR